jgi:hypothetical protein
MNTKVLLFLVTALTLRTRIESDLFRSTVIFAHLVAYTADGMDRHVAYQRARSDADDLINMIKVYREAYKIWVGNATPTPKCTCGGCRVVGWVREQGPTGDQSHEVPEEIHAVDKGNLN